MNTKMQIASGVSVLLTTLGFSHIVFHNTVHMLSHHDESHVFVAAHSVLAVALVILSLAGGFCLLTGKFRRKAN